MRIASSVIGIVVCACPLARAGAQSPGLVADHFTLPLTLSAAFARAEDALRAAGLRPEPPTAISRGGRKPNITVLIHCIESAKATLVDLEVAEIPRKNEEAGALRAFLTEFMKTGKAADSSPAGLWPSFSGDWDTSSGGTSYPMKLSQVGTKVTGSYGDNGYGTIEGTVTNGVLRFRWKQSNGNKGAGRFSILPNGSAFAGAWTYEDDPEKATKIWDGKRIGAAPGASSRPGGEVASGVDYSGTWVTRSYGGYSGKMRLKQEGSRVTGSYEGTGNGTIEGTVSGRDLRFQWTETSGGTGTGKLTLSEDKLTFTGAYSYEKDPDKGDRYWNGKREGAPPASPAGGAATSGTPPETTAEGPAGSSGAASRKQEPLGPLGPTLSPPGFEDKRPTDVFPGISLTAAPVPLPPLGHDVEKQGQAKKYTEPIIISRLRLTRKPVDLTRGLLQIEVSLSRKPIGECYIDLYVGGYLSIDREAMRFYNVYCTTTLHTTVIEDSYTTSLAMPDVLPATVRAELVEYGTGRVIDKREERITAPFADLYLVKVMLWGDAAKSKWDAGAAIITGTVPDDKTVWLDYRTRDRDPSYVPIPNDPDEVGRNFYGYGGSTKGSGISVDKLPGFERIAKPGLTGDAIFFKWNEKTTEPSKPGVKTDGAWVLVSVSPEGVLDERKVVGFSLPNRGYDPSRLVRRPVAP